MANSTSSREHLRLYTEQLPKPPRQPLEDVASLPRLLETFQTATGWSLQYTPEAAKRGRPCDSSAAARIGVNRQTAASCALGVSLSPASLVSDSALSQASPDATVARDAAESLGGAIGGLLGELCETRNVLRKREAELAAGVPTVLHSDEEQHLAGRLEATLRAGAEAIGCDAAALYMLDDATTKLKMRSAWQLPFDRMTAPARPLQGAVADLEALLGHAVVLGDDTLMAMWKVPENFPAAVCVPVSSSTTLLGTLWIFSRAKRDFNDRETNIVEVVAGRIAADLEREMLLRTSTEGAALKKQVAAAERLQQNERPVVAPLLEGWDLAGWTAQASEVGGSFHDWFCLPDGLLAVAAGRAAQEGIPGALTASAVKSAVRSHARYHRAAGKIMPQVNLTLWTGSAGDRHAELFLATITTATGRVSGASAGRPSLLLFDADGWRSLGKASSQIGESPEADFARYDHDLRPGETLVVLTDGGQDGLSAPDRIAVETRIADALRGKLDLSAAQLIDVAKATIDADSAAVRHDRAVLIIRRTAP